MNIRGKILVIDDDLSTVIPVIKYLSSQGFEVQHTPNGGRGVQVVRRFKPDLVLCDMVMPGMSGIEVVKLIKMEMPQTVVIMLSGIQEAEMAEKALSAGAHSYLTKPIALEHIKHRVIERVFG